MQTAVQDLLLNVILGLITIGGLYLLNLINRVINKLKVETDNIKDEKERRLAKDAIERVDKLAGDTVLAIESRAAKEIRELVKQGKAPRDQLRILASGALHEIKDMLEPKYHVALQDTIGDVDTYVKNVIEAKLEMFKTIGTKAN